MLVKEQTQMDGRGGIIETPHIVFNSGKFKVRVGRPIPNTEWSFKVEWRF